MVVVKSGRLEKTTEAFIDDLASKGGTPLYQLSPEEAREVLESVQSSPVEKPQVMIEDKMIPCGPKGEVSIRIYRPLNSSGKLPVIVYFHGAGWVMGSVNTHDRLVRELTIGTEAAVVFVNYSRAPEARFPVANEEAYAVTKYIAEHGSEFNLDVTHLAVSGDSVGGNMAIAITMMAKRGGGPSIDSQVLFYPVTSAKLDTESYREFADGPWLTRPAMEWFWEAYEPNVYERNNSLISPLNGSLDELKDLPPALIITAENDVLRDEGEEYAHRLMKANVDVTAVRLLGTIHDFVMLNALAKTPATREAISLACAFLNSTLHKDA